jgi:hypothetical protein
MNAQAMLDAPSPVKELATFMQDEAMARSLQQLYNDEAQAAEFQEQCKIEDEFEEATRKVQDERSAKLLGRISS